jgi:O-antigen/teichoic acid export membrane protein
LRAQFVGIFVGRAAQFLIALATVRIATTLLSPVEMGRASLIVTTTGFFVFLLINPVGMFINRRLHAWHAQGVGRQHLLAFGGYLFGVAAIAAVCLPLLKVSGAADLGLPLGWQIALVCGSLIIYQINNTAVPLLNLLGYGSAFIVLSIATVAASLIFAASLAWLVLPAAQYWLLGIMVGQAAVGLLGTNMLFHRLHEPAGKHHGITIDRRRVATLLGFAWPVSVAAVLGWIQGQAYRYLLGGELGLSTLGLFVVGYGISIGIISAFESVVTAYFQPRLYKDVSNGDSLGQSKAWSVYGRAMIPSLLLTAVLVVVVAPELSRLFLGRQFQSAAKYVAWGALADVTRAIVAVYSLVAHVKTRTKWLVMPNLIGAAISIGLCLVLIPRIGAVGVGLSLALAGIAVVATMHIAFSPHVEKLAIGRPIGIVCVFALCLWIAAILVRQLVNTSAWWSSFAVLIPVCLLFLWFQFLVLRSHVSHAVVAAGTSRSHSA